MMKNWLLLVPPMWFGPASGISSRSDVVTCVETASANAFTNPSWESGTTGWAYNWPVTTTDVYSTDGSKSLTFTGNTNAGARLIRQTVTGLEVGTTYNVSVDFKAVVNPATALQVSCTFYMYHDTITTNNLITQFSKVYTRNDNAWNTYGGAFTPASSSLELGWVLACSTAASIFNTYFDNAVVKATVDTCSTVSSTPGPTSVLNSVSSLSFSTSGSQASSTIYATVPTASAVLSSLGSTQVANTAMTSMDPASAMPSSGNNATTTLSMSVAPTPVSSSIPLPTSVGNSSFTISFAGSTMTQSTSRDETQSTISVPTILPPRLNNTTTPGGPSTIGLNSSTLVSIITRPTSLPAPSNTTKLASEPTPTNFTSLRTDASSAASAASAAPPYTTVLRNSTELAFPSMTANDSTLSPQTTSSGALALNSTPSSGAMSHPESPPGQPTNGTTGFPTITLSEPSTTLILSTRTFSNATRAPTQTVNAGEALTTLTVLATSVHTIVSCAPTVTGCPANTALPTTLPPGVSTALVTETIELATTICPVSVAASVSSSILSAAAAASPRPTPTGGEALTTLTVQAISVRTVVSCAATITDCPDYHRNSTGPLTSLPKGVNTVLVTETIELSTTVCPATAAEAISSSILSVAARGGITGKILAASTTVYDVAGQSAAAIAGSDATKALSGQSQPTSLPSSGSTLLVGGDGQGEASGVSDDMATGTETEMISAPYQTSASPTTLKAVVQKPCHRSQ